MRERLFHNGASWYALSATLMTTMLQAGCGSTSGEPAVSPKPSRAIAEDATSAETPAPKVGVAAAEPNTADESGANAVAFSYPKINGSQIPASALELVGAEGFGPSDIMQGSLGDCYFNASLAALASANPNWINNIIKRASNDNGDLLVDANGYPLYQITLNYVSGGALTPWHYLTDTMLPSDQNGVLYAGLVQDGSNYKIAGPLLEKAFARLDQDTNYLNNINADNSYKGYGYYAVGQGGWAIDAFPALIGNMATGIDRTQAPAALSAIQAGSGVAVVADINTGFFTPSAQLPSGATIAKQANGTLLYTPRGGGAAITLVDVHYYSFLGAKGDLSTWRNPWGNTSGTNGVFALPTIDIGSIFNRFTEVNVH